MIIFKLPFEEKFYTNGLKKKDSPKIFIESFDSQKKIFFEGHLSEISENEILQTPFQLTNNDKKISRETKEEYLKKIEKTIDFLKKNQREKIVIARRKIIDYENLNIQALFLKISQKYPEAFSYIYQTQEGIWLGAFSELLGKYDMEKSIFKTMSLAGTLKLDQKWGEKEINEQKSVTQYIENILKKYHSGNEILISETYEHISGNIKHLRTDFECKISQENLSLLIQDLHPTPAVCGIPKEKCLQEIQEIEKFDREFYSGYTFVEKNNFKYYFVNLRCGKFFKNKGILFVGGGITPLSIAEKEWEETELKSMAISSLI